MTPEEHYLKAERLAQTASSSISTPGTKIAEVSVTVALAQVHASLAAVPRDVHDAAALRMITNP